MELDFEVQQIDQLRTPEVNGFTYYGELEKLAAGLCPSIPEQAVRLSAIIQEIGSLFDVEMARFVGPYQAFGRLISYVELGEGNHAFTINDKAFMTELNPEEAKRVMLFVKGFIDQETLMGGELNEVAAHTLKNMGTRFDTIRSVISTDGNMSLLRDFLAGNELGLAARFNSFGNIARLIEASRNSENVSARQVGIVLDAIKVYKQFAYRKYYQDGTSKPEVYREPELNFDLMLEEQIDAGMALHLIELVQNAFHCGAENVSVEHCYDETGQFVCYAVTDDGVGVKREIGEKIFEKGETHREGGSGKGLFFFREDVINAGGKVSMTTTTKLDTDSVEYLFEPASIDLAAINTPADKVIRVEYMKRSKVSLPKHTKQSGTSIRFMLPRKLDQTA